MGKTIESASKVELKIKREYLYCIDVDLYLTILINCFCTIPMVPRPCEMGP